MNALAAEVITPQQEILSPSPRLMRAENQENDRLRDGEIRELNPSETSLAWTPRLVPLFSFPFEAPEALRPVRAGNAMAIVRDGYESNPLGIVTDIYRPVDHQETVSAISESTMGKCEREGALIDGHGYHVVHTFRLNTPSTEHVRGLPLVSRLTLVHDHTGSGSLRASVVTYIGNSIVVGSSNYTRRIHVGAGEHDVGVDSRSRWLDIVDAMLETAMLQQGAIATMLRAADAHKMDEKTAAIFESADVKVDRAKVTPEELAAGKKGDILAATALDVVISHHAQRAGLLSWGVWARRLEGDALACLEEITDVKLPKQIFRRG